MSEKLKPGDRVTLNFAALSNANRQYWEGNAGDGTGRVELRNGRRAYVRFGTGLAGWFDDDALANMQGDLFA